MISTVRKIGPKRISKLADKEIKTRWDIGWLDFLNESVAPLIKDVRFETYQTMLNVEVVRGGQDHSFKVPGQQHIKIVISMNSKYFLQELKTGKLDEDQLIKTLHDLVIDKFDCNLYKKRKFS